MNSINVFNKQIIELQGTFIQDFIEKIKINIPEEHHSTLDQQLKEDMDLIKDNIKNINKKHKKIINKDAPKKPTKANCWRLFCAHKSKEYPDASQNEKWGLASAEWAELKLNGGDKYWKDLADQLNSEIDDSTPVTVTKQAPKKAAPPTKKAAPKKAAATKKAAPVKDIQMDDDDQDQSEDEFIFVNQQQQDIPQITI